MRSGRAVVSRRARLRQAWVDDPPVEASCNAADGSRWDWNLGGVVVGGVSGELLEGETTRGRVGQRRVSAVYCDPIGITLFHFH